MGKNCHKMAKKSDEVIVKFIFYVIKMRQLKKKFSRVLAGYLENGPIDFHKTYAIFSQSYVEVVEMKRLNQ